MASVAVIGPVHWRTLAQAGVLFLGQRACRSMGKAAWRLGVSVREYREIEAGDHCADGGYMGYEGNEMAGAIFSPDRRYRYALWRRYSSAVPSRTISWVLLNPSTADAVQLDPTLRRCRGYTRLWQYDRMNVLNLYAFRDRDPDVMRRQVDPVGPDNVDAIREYVNESELCIAAWGEKVLQPGRLDWLRELVAPVPVHVLGYTKGGEPRHPLYMRRDCGHRAASEGGGPMLQKGQKATIDVNKAERDAIEQVLKSPRHALDTYERDLLTTLLGKIDKAAPPSSGANPAGGSPPPSTP